MTKENTHNKEKTVLEDSVTPDLLHPEIIQLFTKNLKI